MGWQLSMITLKGETGTMNLGLGQASCSDNFHIFFFPFSVLVFKLLGRDCIITFPSFWKKFFSFPFSCFVKMYVLSVPRIYKKIT